MNKHSITLEIEKIKDPYSGLGQYCFHLKKELSKIDSSINFYEPTKIQKLARIFPQFLPNSKIFHILHQDSSYMPSNPNTKVVLTIHDLNALSGDKSEKTKHRYYNKYKKRIDRADIITFISHFSKSEVEKKFDLTGKKLKVIYNGIAIDGDAQKPDLNVSGDFIFSMGTVLPKKNFHVLIDMMKLLPQYKLVIAGNLNGNYAKEMIEKIKTLNLENQIIMAGKIDESHKIWFYENAKAFVFPSLFEGFGLPIAEAMSKGLPLFLSKHTSIPEVGGDDAYYFENFNPEHMAKIFVDGMNNFNEDRRKRLIERSKIFSWEKAARDYYEIYRELLN